MDSDIIACRLGSEIDGRKTDSRNGLAGSGRLQEKVVALTPTARAIIRSVPSGKDRIRKGQMGFLPQEIGDNAKHGDFWSVRRGKNERVVPPSAAVCQQENPFSVFGLEENSPASDADVGQEDQGIHPGAIALTFSV